MINKCYVEKCTNNTMLSYPFFFDKLTEIEGLVKQINHGPTKKFPHCTDCSETDSYYKLSRIMWPKNLTHMIKSHQSYPSEFFIRMIMNTSVIDNRIINRPLIVKPNRIRDITYVPLYHNKLQILDALMSQGSQPRYQGKANSTVYSEHSGSLVLSDDQVDQIIVNAESSRSDPLDQSILLPSNNELFGSNEFLFHTHPNAKTYAGRISEGIVYEFPSANDILNFVKYKSEGRTQASVIVAPEGMYVIRPIRYEKIIKSDKRFYKSIQEFVLGLESKAVRSLRRRRINFEKLSDPDYFHKIVSLDFRFVRSYNKFLRPHNLYVEYYPREKKRGEWHLRPMALSYVKSQK